MNTSNAINPGMNCDPEKRRMEAALVQSEGEQEGGEKERVERADVSVFISLAAQNILGS